MVRRLCLVIFLTIAASIVAAAPAPPNGPRLIRLAPQSSAKQVGAFRYRLLPDPLDRTPGNAATLWRFAGDALHEVKHKMTNEEYDWAAATPPQKLPRKEVHDLLAHYTGTLRLARQAACRERCDWELPPLTFQTIQAYLPLSMLQNCRTLATLLSIQCRLQLVEGRFDDAAETLQTGFAMSRHLCQGDLLIQNLVGIAIATIMLGQVEEWIQTPGSPNLYWALTDLPRPFCDLRRSIEHEWNTFHRSFPNLRRLRNEKLTERQAKELVKEVFDVLNKLAEDNATDIAASKRTRDEAEKFRKFGESIRAGESYSKARQHLLDLGQTAKEIDALSKTQVILLWYVDQYDRVRDDVLKLLSLPTWQATPQMEATFKEGHNTENVILRLLIPSSNKIWIASNRLERQIAGLRCAEALRLYAAKHEGKPPAKWSDITEVPLPIDPITGKGFDEFYAADGLLEVPPPPDLPVPLLGRRYELVPRR